MCVNIPYHMLLKICTYKQIRTCDQRTEWTLLQLLYSLKFNLDNELKLTQRSKFSSKISIYNKVY